jgi:L-ascorbate metabolism protein UlaG (beta-lactamase superfamily)
MEIIWHGHSFFEIAGKTGYGKIALAIDPFGKNIGLRPKKVKADILLSSHGHDDHSNKSIVEIIKNPEQKNPFFYVEDPGEYDIKGVKIKGVSSFHDSVEGKDRGVNTIFIVEIEGIKICHMGDFGEKELSKDQANEIVGVDVLLVPVGGEFTISGKEAVSIVGQVEPKIVIPMHYKTPGVTAKLEDESKFLSIIGTKEKEKISKLKIQRADLERKEGTEVVIMEKI